MLAFTREEIMVFMAKSDVSGRRLWLGKAMDYS
jgi:hypothetical protein